MHNTGAVEGLSVKIVARDGNCQSVQLNFQQVYTCGYMCVCVQSGNE
jgi:hypothetical protein